MSTLGLGKPVFVRKETGSTEQLKVNFTRAYGPQHLQGDDGLTYQPSTGTLTANIFDGTMSGSATKVDVTNDTSTASTCYPSFVDDTGSDKILKASKTKLEYVPSSGTLSATVFSGPLTGNVTGNLTGDVTGDITGNADTATQAINLGIAEDTTSALVYPVFVADTGIRPPKINKADLKLNSAVGQLTARRMKSTVGFEATGALDFTPSAGGFLSYDTTSTGTTFIDSFASVGSFPNPNGQFNFGVGTVAGVRTEVMRIDGGGLVGIGTSSPTCKLDLGLTGGSGSQSKKLALYNNNYNIGAVAGFYGFGTGAGTLDFHANAAANSTPVMTLGSNGAASPTGTLIMNGAISKYSGNFNIEHPLLGESHRLIHSFVESSDALNIYTGIAQLEQGEVEINLDLQNRMTNGTFVLLNRDIRVVVSNNDMRNWDQVKATINGNKLLIISNNNQSDAIVTYMVTGIRHDAWMRSDCCEDTDCDGELIVEREAKKAKPYQSMSTQESHQVQ